MSESRVLVVGTTGQLGSVITRKLIARADVVSL
jgi:nucleoside-diphosphate-sugar epimerase